MKSLLSERGKKRFITSKTANLLFMVMLFTLIMFCVPAFAADDILTSVKSLLSKAAISGGGLWAAWGVVQFGIGLKDHNGPGISGGIWQVLGGGCIVAAGAIINAVDLAFSTTPTTP